MEQLPLGARPLLVEEILGQRPVQLSLRLNEMKQLGVFDIVAAAVHSEISAATAALADWPDEPPTPLLLGLCDLLRTQVTALEAPR